MLRRVHPAMQQEGRPSSINFSPHKNDEGLLSVDDGAFTTPKQAFDAFIASGKQVYGIWGITNGEYLADDLHCYSDPVPNNYAHALVDFTAKSSGELKVLAAKHFAYATSRGMLYPQAGEESDD